MNSDIFSFNNSKSCFCAGILACLVAKILLRYQFPLSAVIILGLCILVSSFVNLDYAVVLWVSISIIGDFFGMELPLIPRLYLSEIMLLIVFSAWFLKALLNKNIGLFPEINAYLFIFLLWGIISIMISTVLYSNDASLLHALKVRMSGYSLLLFALMSYILTINYSLAAKGNIKKIIYGIFVSFYVISPLHLCVSLLLGHTWETLPQFYAIMGGNFIGAYYNIVSILSLSFLLMPDKKKTHFYFYFITMCISVVSTVLLDERMSLIALLLSVMVILFLKSKKIFLLVGGIALVALSVYAVEFNEYIRNKFQYQTIHETMFMTSGTASWDRIPIALDAIKIIKNHCVAGIGFDDYSGYSDFIAFGANHSFPVASAHNDYLEIGVNMGIIGLILYLLFIVLFGKKIILLYRSIKGSEYQPILFACIVIYFVFLLHSFAGEVIVGAFGNGELMRFSYRVYFWIIMGIAVAIYKIEKDKCYLVKTG